MWPTTILSGACAIFESLLLIGHLSGVKPVSNLSWLIKLWVDNFIHLNRCTLVSSFSLSFTLSFSFSLFLSSSSLTFFHSFIHFIHSFFLSFSLFFLSLFLFLFLFLFSPLLALFLSFSLSVFLSFSLSLFLSFSLFGRARTHAFLRVLSRATRQKTMLPSVFDDDDDGRI